MPGQEPTPELTELEEKLRRLAPGEGKLDRDALLYRAGRASARRGWLWPAVACVSSLTAAVLGVVLATRPAPAVVERIVYVPAEAHAPAPPTDIPPGELPAYPVALEDLPPRLRLQERLLLRGLDGLGERPPAPAPASRDFFSHYSDFIKGESNP